MNTDCGLGPELVVFLGVVNNVFRFLNIHVILLLMDSFSET